MLSLLLNIIKVNWTLINLNTTPTLVEHHTNVSWNTTPTLVEHIQWNIHFMNSLVTELPIYKNLFCEKVFLKISQNSRKNFCVRIRFYIAAGLSPQFCFAKSFEKLPFFHIISLVAASVSNFSFLKSSQGPVPGITWLGWLYKSAENRARKDKFGSMNGKKIRIPGRGKPKILFLKHSWEILRFSVKIEFLLVFQLWHQTSYSFG